MTTPFLAPSLLRLRAEIDTRWPNRDRRSDGWIGDAAHRSTPSDHNPDSRGMVHAIDVDIDGIDKALVLKTVIGDARVWYVIHAGKIWSRTYGWAEKPYNGASPHTAHIHISGRYDSVSENSTARWLPVPQARPAPRPVVDLSWLARVARINPWGYRAGTRTVQAALRAEGLLGHVIPGRFGATTRRAYARWQTRLGYSGQDANGIPGLTSLTKLGKKHGFTVAP